MSKFENLSKEELLKLVDKQEKELASKKYGLVWDSEREPEQVVLDCANNLPVLKRVKGKEIKTDDSEDNILIEGDNYHALTVLNYTHKEKIDVIYIDPPYNTGNKDFIYNDRYVDKNDSHPHSKWLNFMEKRLNLAERLLKKTGVIFISIDDNEVAQLKLLCDKIFGEDNFISNLVWENREGGGSSDSKHFKIKHEYIIVYAKNKNMFILNKEKITDEDAYTHSDKYEKERGKHKLIKLNSASIQYSKSLDYPIIALDKTKIVPSYGKKKACWRWSKEKFEWGIKNDFIEISKGKKGNWVVYSKQYLKVDNENNPIDRQKAPLGVIPFFSSTMATKQLENIFHKKVFDYSKPYLLIQYLLKLSTNQNSMVIDFMAGSGTTGQAVLELNKEDEGSRKFILCSNNENNNGDGKIMDDVCYPRIQKVIKGYKKNGNGEKIEGLGGNLQYFKTDLVKETKSKIQVKIDLTQKCAGMLCVKENIFNFETEKEDFKIFSSNKKDKFLCVYFNFLEDSFDDFLKEIKKLKGKKFIYMFSLENKIKKSLFNSIENKEIKPIPQEILDIYEELVRKNISIKKEIIFLELEKARKKVFEEKEKDDGAKNLRIVLEKILQKIAQQNGINFLGQSGKEEKISITNDKLKSKKIISRVLWEENKTYLTIGNDAMHGKYDDFDLSQVENFYKYTQNLINKFNF